MEEDLGAAIVDGQTPLDPDETAGLIPDLTTRAELNQFEQQNIGRAISWARRSRILRAGLLTPASVRLVHRRMFDETWRWAGQFRLTGKNIGVEAFQIANRLAAECGNVQFWIDNQTFPLDEIAIRFHHQLVLIHCFPNGNGRHARLCADLLLHFSGRPPLPWGGGSLVVATEERQEYIAALREADKRRFEALLRFCRGQI